jgi:cell wall-associated protease
MRFIFKPGFVIFVIIHIVSSGFSQPIRKNPIPKNWLEKDPVSDSLAGISLDKAYQLLKGRKSHTVIVAVIDNGVDLSHEDLKSIIWTNPKEIPGNGIDDDKNGYIDDVHGWNFRGANDGTIIENEQAGATQYYFAWKSRFENTDSTRILPEDRNAFLIYKKAKQDYFDKQQTKDSAEIRYVYNLDYHSSQFIFNDKEETDNHDYGSPYIHLSPNLSHGTHVAGIIGAQRNNGIGVNGIADNILIMPIVATTATGDERDKDIANAIFYAVNNGAKLINMSFSKSYSSDKKRVDSAVRYAEKNNVLIIHAAGNDGMNIDSPSNFHYPVVIFEDGKRAGNFMTVGWNRPLFDYRLAHPYSDYGHMNVDLFAPGSDIYSTVPNNAYDEKSGSSMSTPVVTGVAALLLSYFPSLSAQQVKDILLKSVFIPDQMVNMPKTKTPVPFKSLSVSGGIVNAYEAVKTAIRLSDQPSGN